MERLGDVYLDHYYWYFIQLYLQKKMSRIFGLAFFSSCSVVILHLLFLSSDTNLKRSILVYILTYGSLNLAYTVFKNRNLPNSNYRISLIHAIGWLLGFTAGLYFGSQASIYLGFGSIDSSNIAVGICLMFGVANGEIGSFLGKAVLPI